MVKKWEKKILQQATNQDVETSAKKKKGSTVCKHLSC